MIEVDAGSGAGPLGMPPAQFLREYWQKEPLLVRNAFPSFQSPITPEDLAGLACEDGVLARIVSHDRRHDRWTLETGPFDEAGFPSRPDRDWTLLVQDVDKWDPDVRGLLEHFAFLPRWRVDDIMVSFAAPGGSVGPHIDQYDVFLLQAHGHRRWQIDTSPAPDTTFRDDAEIRLLRSFHASHDWVLGPGDMLYLPPGVPHNGVAEDACLTISVGMRAPSAAQLLDDYVAALTADADDALRLADPDLKPAADPFEIDAAAMERVVAALNALRMRDPEALADWFGRYITTFRNAREPAPADDAPDVASLEEAMRAGMVLWRHPWTRMAWRRSGRGARLHANGLSLPCAVADARHLAAAERVDAALWHRLGAAGRAAVAQLAQAGHYALERDEDA